MAFDNSNEDQLKSVYRGTIDLMKSNIQIGRDLDEDRGRFKYETDTFLELENIALRELKAEGRGEGSFAERYRTKQAKVTRIFDADGNEQPIHSR